MVAIVPYGKFTKGALMLIKAVTIVTILSLAVSPPENEVPGETLARMQQLGEELATPNKHHKFLEQMAGEWLTESSFMELEPTTGTASYSMILGDRYLDGFHQGDFMGAFHKGRLTVTFDNYKNKYVATFINNLTTTLLYAEGLVDQSGKVLSLWGTMDEWLTDEHDKPVLYRFTIVDEDNYIFEVHDVSLGDNSKVIEVLYTRVEQ